MIDLSWNTQGRVALEAYRKARWIHFAWCLIPIAIYVVTFVSSDAMPGSPATLPILTGGITVATILLCYYRFRFLQVMIKRLQDTGHSGKLLLLWPFAWLIAICVIIASGILAAGADVITLPTWMDIDHSPWLLWAVLAPFLIFNLYLRFQLARPGMPGANRYGAAAATRAAGVF